MRVSKLHTFHYLGDLMFNPYSLIYKKKKANRSTVVFCNIYSRHGQIRGNCVHIQYIGVALTE